MADDFVGPVYTPPALYSIGNYRGPGEGGWDPGPENIINAMKSGNARMVDVYRVDVVRDGYWDSDYYDKPVNDRYGSPAEKSTQLLMNGKLYLPSNDWGMIPSWQPTGQYDEEGNPVMSNTTGAYQIRSRSGGGSNVFNNATVAFNPTTGYAVGYNPTVYQTGSDRGGFFGSSALGGMFNDLVSMVKENPVLPIALNAALPGAGTAIGSALGLGEGALASAAGSSLLGGATSAASGGDFLQGALSGGLGSLAGSALNAGATVPGAEEVSAAQAAAQGMGGYSGLEEALAAQAAAQSMAGGAEQSGLGALTEATATPVPDQTALAATPLEQLAQAPSDISTALNQLAQQTPYSPPQAPGDYMFGAPAHPVDPTLGMTPDERAYYYYKDYASGWGEPTIPTLEDWKKYDGNYAAYAADVASQQSPLSQLAQESVATQAPVTQAPVTAAPEVVSPTVEQSPLSQLAQESINSQEIPTVSAPEAPVELPQTQAAPELTAQQALDQIQAEQSQAMTAQETLDQIRAEQAAAAAAPAAVSATKPATGLLNQLANTDIGMNLDTLKLAATALPLATGALGAIETLLQPSSTTPTSTAAGTGAADKRQLQQWDWNKINAAASAQGLQPGQFVARNLGRLMGGEYNVAKMAKGGALNALAQGGGSGRDDTIPARLSDGEYVLDAETVSLLGDGSTNEGARRLDQMRAKIRKHKGKSMATGRFSADAKSPLTYLKEA
jgi:hypothetical protein